MPNHPNRALAPTPARNPTPAEIRAIRLASRLSQANAAALIYCTLRAWQEWEAGRRAMHPQLWEAFRVKTGALRWP